MAATGIRYYRDRAGLKQVDLAKQLEIDPGLMSKIESGDQIPTAVQVDRIAEILEVVPTLLWSRHILAEVAERARAELAS